LAAAFLGAGVEATAGAGAGVSAFLGADFLSAGILFDLTAEEEEDISNALIYSLPTAVM
jgi:hypothetical protein